MKYFCTAGPIQSDIHYYIPPLDRWNKVEMLDLIAARKYFILHAPRQTGKTTCMLALVKELNWTGNYRALYMNVEAAQAARDDSNRAIRIILSRLGHEASSGLGDSFPDERALEIFRSGETGDAITRILSEWCARDPRPVVLMVDEIDALIGDSLISVLRQLRSGYEKRPERFPQSIILCGVRDVRDYRIHSSSTKEIITGGSAFNVKAKSLRLGDFTPEDVRRLYEQHTTETGQRFEEDVYALVWDLTRGQPWLVNALAQEACFEMVENRDRTRTITAEIVQEAKERLIVGRETHLDQLADKLLEERVRRVVQPILANEEKGVGAEFADDVQYLIDLGLLRRSGVGLEIANAIYKEVIPRELNFGIQLDFEALQRSEWYIGADGRIEMEKLMLAFQQFFRENAEIWLERFKYREAGPQLLLQAFLQRVVNGGGRIEREYGLGRKRTDLLVIWKHPGGVQRVVIEIKVVRGSMARVMEQGLAQTAEYMDRCGAAEGHLVIFDAVSARSWDEKISHHREGAIEVWGM